MSGPTWEASYHALVCAALTAKTRDALAIRTLAELLDSAMDSMHAADHGTLGEPTDWRGCKRGPCATVATALDELAAGFAP